MSATVEKPLRVDTGEELGASVEKHDRVGHLTEGFQGTEELLGFIEEHTSVGDR